MTYRFIDRTVESVADLLAFMKDDHGEVLSGTADDRRDRPPGIWYRGLPSETMALLPTLHREKMPVEDEVHLMNRFKQNAHQFLSERPQGEWEWSLLARHHGLPSRLMDWTENPLVGLFFASQGESSTQDSSCDGALWCLLPICLNQMAHGGTIRSGVLPIFLDERDSSEESSFLTNYRTSHVARTQGAPPVPPAAAMSIRTNRRIQAQQGVFTVHHASAEPLDKLENRSYLWRYIVPNGKKGRIRDELRHLGISDLTLFPNLDNVAAEARARY